MKILAISDLHQMNNKWKLLVKVCQENKYDVVAIAGDIFPKDNGIENQLPFINHIKKYVSSINETGAKVVLILGNDDNQLAIPHMIDGHKNGLWYYIPENVIEINGCEFAAMPYVPDYPFGYKFWCRAESKNYLRISLQQFCDPLLIDENTKKFKTIPNYTEYLKNNKSIWDSLTDTVSKVKDISKSIWMIHAPPSDMELDLCSNGERVGSSSVYKFIEQYQPLLTIHGHIHESPEYSNVWKCQSKKTWCVQSGQITVRLFYSEIEIQDGNVVGIKHSYYQ